MRLAALLAGLLLVTAGCGSGESDEAAPSTTAAAEVPSGAIAGATLDGKRLSLDDYRGRRVLVNVWSSW
jgi:cytochrome oxidase Cu insertion factor (SCO1/SenC/PrrC family)